MTLDIQTSDVEPVQSGLVSYGTIRYRLKGRKYYWVVDCLPHVRNRLKRVFPEIDQWKRKELHLADTPENCRDLLWFTERYPMDIAQSSILKQGAVKHSEMEAKITGLLAGITSAKPFELAIPARDYQALAAEVCVARGGLLLGDKVGLGKSVSAICPMTDPNNLPVLVVTLTHLTKQWKEYLEKFAPSLTSHILKSTTPYDLTKLNKVKKGEPVPPPEMPNVIICNYHKLYGWITKFPGMFKYIVFDEIQELRRKESNKYSAAKDIADATPLKMGLSATPIYNYGAEFYNVLDVLCPGELGTFEEFQREWCQDQILTDPEAFGSYLKSEGMFLVRTRKDVGRELPPVSKVVYPIAVDMDALEAVKSSAIDLAKIIIKDTQEFKTQKLQASGEFNMLLRQATGVAKAPYVAEFVKMLLESEDRVVLFGWHHQVYDIWKDLLSEYNPVFYTGRESTAQKEESKRRFIEGDSRVMIISLRAGAGMDGIQDVCRVAVIGELDWSPGVHVQNIGRIDRDPSIGELDTLSPAFAYFLVASEGSDPVLSDILGLKTQQIDGVVSDGDLSLEELQIEPDHLKKLAGAYLKSQGITEKELEEIDQD